MLETPELQIAGDPSTSLYHVLDADVLPNPHPFYRRLREQSPVHWDPYLHAWVVTRYDDVTHALSNYLAKQAHTPEVLEEMGAAEATPIAQVLMRQMMFMNAKSHARLRKLAGAPFQPARIRVLHERIHAIAERLIDAIIARGDGKMNLLSEFAEPLPAIVTTEILGVPMEDHLNLKVWSTRFAEMFGNFHYDHDRLPVVLDATQRLIQYFEQRIAEQRKTPREGLVNIFMNAEMDGDRLSNDEIVANCILVLVGGLEEITNLTTTGMLTLLRNPEQLAWLRNNMDQIPAAIEELLRYESPTQFTVRVAPDDVELRGQKIMKGQAVLPVIAAANRDPEYFPDPDRLDFTRQGPRHLAFGWGAHFCFGAPLARTELQIAFEMLLRRFSSLALTDEPPAWRENIGLRGLGSLPLTYKLS